MAVPSIPRHVIGEPVTTYVVDSWDGLSRLPFANRPGLFSVTYYPPETSGSPDTDEAFQGALADAVRRGRPKWLEVMASEGGVVSAQQMGTLLGISRQAVDKRRRTGTLLGFQDRGTAYLYPVWQVRDGAVLPGLERVLAALKEGEHGAKSQFIFFLSPDVVPDDARPLDLLRSGTEEDIHRAEHAGLGYLVQGSA